MCLGIPARIVALTDHPHLVDADVFGAKRTINVGLIEEGVVPGEWVLIHVGFAVSKLDEAEVAQAEASLGMVGSAGEDAERFEVWGIPETTEEEVQQWA
ncbi:MAG: HypC/HybG/HupF family hydrogenase formation chaperone [Acidimicrobiales bacterium]